MFIAKVHSRSVGQSEFGSNLAIAVVTQRKRPGMSLQSRPKGRCRIHTIMPVSHWHGKQVKVNTFFTFVSSDDACSPSLITGLLNTSCTYITAPKNSHSEVHRTYIQVDLCSSCARTVRACLPTIETTGRLPDELSAAFASSGGLDWMIFRGISGRTTALTATRMSKCSTETGTRSSILTLQDQGA